MLQVVSKTESVGGGNSRTPLVDASGTPSANPKKCGEEKEREEVAGERVGKKEGERERGSDKRVCASSPPAE